MLGANISTSERVADLMSTDSQLFYTWSLPHTDDLKILTASIRELRATVAPYKDYSLTQIQQFVDEYVKSGLYIKIEHQGKEYFYVPDPQSVNTLRRDRYPQSILSIEKIEGKSNETWEKAEKLIKGLLQKAQETSGKETVTSGIPPTTKQDGSDVEGKLREDKISKEKVREININNGKEKNSASPLNENPPTSVLGVDLTGILEPNTRSGISKQWQAKAFRHAEYLKISLVDEAWKKRWLKFYRDKYCPKVDQTVSYLVDYYPFLVLKDPEAQIKYFFKVFNDKP